MESALGSTIGYVELLSSHQTNAQTGFDVVGAAVLVLEVVGVLPDVNAVDGGAACH